MSHINSKRELCNSYNSLICLAQGLIDEYTTVDLRNEMCVSGKIDSVDGFMNITMSDVIVTNQAGDEFYYENFFVKARSIRYVHIPSGIPIKEAIRRGLESLAPKKETSKRTFKETRAQRNQQATLALIAKLKEERLKKEEASGKKT